MLVLSGGTSKGAGDLSHRIVSRLGAPGILVHGVALKPGKPLCLAVADGKPVAVLPGFPTSAIFTFHAFVAPVIRALSYEVVEMPPYDPNRQDTVTDTTGREWKLMRTTHGEEGWIASSYLRFLLDHRIGFEKTADGWQMIFFVAGD